MYHNEHKLLPASSPKRMCFTCLAEERILCISFRTIAKDFGRQRATRLLKRGVKRKPKRDGTQTRLNGSGGHCNSQTIEPKFNNLIPLTYFTHPTCLCCCSCTSIDSLGTTNLAVIMAGKYTIPSAEELEASLNTWQTTWVRACSSALGCAPCLLTAGDAQQRNLHCAHPPPLPCAER